MTVYALDSNIVSYWLKDDVDVINAYRKEARKGNICVLPPIVYYEVKRGLLAINSANKLKIFEEFCQDFEIGEVDLETWSIAAQIYADLRKKGLPIDDADIIIAAFCIVNDYTLVTNNTKHFQNIKDLKLTNWKNN